MNSIQEALSGALKTQPLELPEPQTASGNGSGTLPNLEEIEVLSAEEIKRRHEEALLRRQWVESAAQKIQLIQDQIEALEEIVADGVPTPEDMAKLASLTKALENIGAAGDDNVKRHLEFASFILAIKTSPPVPENLEYFLREAIKRRHYKNPSEKEGRDIETAINAALASGMKMRDILDGKAPGVPRGTILHQEKIFIPAWKEGEKWPSQRAVEVNLARFAGGVRKAEHDAEIARLKTLGNPDLSGLDNGIPDVYRLHFPAHTDRQGRRRHEGVGLVEVQENLRDFGRKKFRDVVVLEGAGSLEWLNQLKGRYISHSWIHIPIPAKVTGDLRNFSIKFSCAIQGAIKDWQRLNPEPMPATIADTTLDSK